MTGARTPALIWCPFPDADAALAVIDTLLDEALIACGNVLPGMQSRFVWNGQKDSATETGALLKTNAARLARAVSRLSELHPYEEPAIVAWHCETGAPGTLAWLAGIGD
ncbi:divalent-cation tolerance protein CutA [Novosphingobium sp. RD2P27]|uniref:Divalent-cation tolerance protein CutA n=1 Tax=Novosphingobium kalidii TaxID=3230299 RepID=A0ABV2CWX0_9SPHN